MPDLQDTLQPPTTSILKAMEILVANRHQIILVVDGAGKLLGTVTDGDIRRGILRRVPLESPISVIMQGDPITVPPGTSRESALRMMREREIRHLPVVDGQRRVISLEALTDLLRQATLDNWVLLMAGGAGTRLRPITDTLPKPLINVGGKPLLETILESCVAQGFQKFYVSVNYKADMIMAHFGDGRKWGADIVYLTEAEPLGTAGALTLLPMQPTSPLLVMNGDILTSVNFRQLLAFHNEHKAKATMCVREYDIEVPFGVVTTEQHRLRAITEKPVHSFFVNAGIYLLNPEVIECVPRGRSYDMPKVFEDLIARGEETVAFPVQEYWMDIGRAHDLERAQTEIGRFFPGTP